MTTADYDLTLKAKKYPDLTYNYICTNQAKRSLHCAAGYRERRVTALENKVKLATNHL